MRSTAPRRPVALSGSRHPVARALRRLPALVRRGGIGPGTVAVAVALAGSGLPAAAQETPAADSTSGDWPALATFPAFQRAMDELSNWGRWGDDDELGAANLITPEVRARAAALVTEGVTVSLAHDVVQAPAEDGSTILERDVVSLGPGSASDRYAYTGTYHGTIHSHLDALDCHIMYRGEGYNGVSMEEIESTGACPRGDINALKDGVVTRGVLFDATLLPGVGTGEGWVEPGTPIRAADLERLEEIQGVRVRRGDVILLYTGRWKRRAARGPSPVSDGVAGWHANVAYFLKERGVAFIGHDKWNDAYPHEFSEEERLPLHRLALVSLGVGIFDNLDFERLVETARRLDRYTFLFTAAPLRIEGGMGSPLNPVAVF